MAASADRAQRQLNGGTAGLGDSDGRFEPQQIAAQFQKRLSLMVGKESEMADADETLGQSVLQEPPQELGGRDGHLLLLVAVRVIPPQKSHLTTRFVASFLYGIKSNDPWTLSLAAGVLALVATLAGFLPAHRASRLDPMIALREE